MCGADLVGQDAGLAGGDAGVGLGRAIIALDWVGQLGCDGGGLGRAQVVMLVGGRGEAQVGTSAPLWAGADLEGLGGAVVVREMVPPDGGHSGGYLIAMSRYQGLAG